MSHGFGILFERGNLDPSVTSVKGFGNYLSNWSNRDLACRDAGVPNLDDFWSATPEDAPDYAEFGEIDLKNWREEWYSPSEALTDRRAEKVGLSAATMTGCSPTTSPERTGANGDDFGHFT